jgi:hypothetical protein
MEPDAIVATWGRDWREALPTRSPAEQSVLLAEARRAVGRLQAAARGNGRAGHALHRKSLVETSSATFEVASAVPAPLRIGPFMPNAKWPALIRLSSAFPVARPDDVPDQRGLGVHLVDHERRLDLLATTGEAHHARDASAMIASLDAAASVARGGALGKLGALVTLIRAIGLVDALRMTKTISRAAEHGVSLAAMTFFSRAPFQLGAFAVRYRFAPDGDVDPTLREAYPRDPVIPSEAVIPSAARDRDRPERGPSAGTTAIPHLPVCDGHPASLARNDKAARNDNGSQLADDLRQRLADGPVRWSFDVQGYLDPTRTPLDDHRVAWQSPWIPLARLTVTDVVALGTPLTLRAAPSWPASNGPVLEPLGDLNMLRGAAYEVSQRGR